MTLGLDLAITAVGLQASSIDNWTEQSSQYGTWRGTQQEEHLAHKANMALGLNTECMTLIWSWRCI